MKHVTAYDDDFPCIHAHEPSQQLMPEVTPLVGAHESNAEDFCELYRNMRARVNHDLTTQRLEDMEEGSLDGFRAGVRYAMGLPGKHPDEQ